MSGPVDFESWYEAGRAAGFVGEGFCATHDGTPFTEAEGVMFDEEGIDACTPSLRVFPDGDALDVIGWELPASTRPCWAHPMVDGKLTWYPNGHGPVPWYEVLNGAEGPTGAAFLHAIIGQLEADPARYEAMNPPNKWGSYDSLLRVLREMRDAVPERPTTWRTSG